MRKPCAAKGRFKDDDCAHIWSDSSYAGMHPELLALMTQFELCYQLPDIKPPTWLAPQLLPPSMPVALKEWDKVNDLVLSYRYDFLPKGLISRLIVRMHRYMKQPDLAWVSGALFEYGDTKLVVRTTARGDEIVLRARGLDPRGLLSVIASDLDALNDSFEGLENKVEKRVPCCCAECQTSTQPEFFDESKLRRRKHAGKFTVECDRSYESVNVLTLLDGLRLEELPSGSGSIDEPSITVNDDTTTQQGSKMSSTSNIKTLCTRQKQITY